MSTDLLKANMLIMLFFGGIGMLISLCFLYFNRYKSWYSFLDYIISTFLGMIIGVTSGLIIAVIFSMEIDAKHPKKTIFIEENKIEEWLYRKK